MLYSRKPSRPVHVKRDSVTALLVSFHANNSVSRMTSICNFGGWVVLLKKGYLKIVLIRHS